VSEPLPPLHPLPNVPAPTPPPLPPDPWQPPRPVTPTAPLPTMATSVSLDLLVERRTLFLRGVLDDGAATTLCAELMALDAASSRPVTLLLHSPGGPLEAAVPVIDTMGLLRAPVEVTCLGQAAGTATIVLVAATGRRSITPHATVTLRTPPHEPRSGDAEDLRRAVDEHERLARQLAEVVAGRCRLSIDDVLDHLSRGPLWSADQAVDLGLADGIAERHR
jgi:ATP-dependent Clp protease, protease subunit